MTGHTSLVITPGLPAKGCPNDSGAYDTAFLPFCFFVWHSSAEQEGAEALHSYCFDLCIDAWYGILQQAISAKQHVMGKASGHRSAFKSMAALFDRKNVTVVIQDAILIDISGSNASDRDIARGSGGSMAMFGNDNVYSVEPKPYLDTQTGLCHPDLLSGDVYFCMLCLLRILSAATSKR